MTGRDRTGPDATGQDRTRLDETRQVTFKGSTMTKKPMGRLEMHQDTRLLLAHLVQRFVRDGVEFVSWQELTAAIGGRSVQQEARGLLMTARRQLNRDEGIILEALPGEGLSRQRDIGEYLDKAKRAIGRAARKKSNAALAALDTNGIDNESRKRACLELSLLGAITMLTQPKARKQIEGKVAAESPKELPTADTLRAQFGE